MKQLWFFVVFVPALAAISISQTPRAEDAGIPQSAGARLDELLQSKQIGSGLLELAEQDAYRMEGPMRAWGIWQVARVYQATDKKKALQLLDAALAEAAAMKDVPAPKMQEDMTRAMNGGSAKSTRAWLQEQAARTVIMVDPSRSDELLPTLDAANRGPILQALMSYYERRKMTDRAMEQFYKIAAEDEAPYDAAMRIMASLKAEQSGELTGMLSACLASYRAHAPHVVSSTDEFPKLVATYWPRVPKQLARDAIDEIIQQAQDSDANQSFAFSFDKTGGSVGSLLEYRLVQLMPALQELEGSKAKEYLERFPSVGGLAGTYAASTSSGPAAAGNPASSQASFRVFGDSGNLFLNMAEKPLAEKTASETDAGQADQAIGDAAKISNPDLRVQAFEYIARATMKKDATVAASALAKMLTSVEKVNLDRQPGYYNSAAGIFITIGDLEAAKDAIEKGLGSASQLYKQDTDSDDPNTALEAFWPSTNAYCALLRQARKISERWAVKLLKEIDDPEIRFAAETAIAGGILDVPESRATIITSKRKSFRMSQGADLPADSKD
jgi:hypothetical protein